MAATATKPIPKAEATKPKPMVLAPMLGETQSQFFDRASRALQKSIPSVNRRTVEILRIWRASPNAADLQHKAISQFPEDKFTHFGPRCVFLEHTVPANGEGQEIVYNRAALQKLVDWANYRIKNSDNFTAISEGHTPSISQRDAGAPMPAVLGYDGPFYIGLMGDLDPKWAIYADEWAHNEDLQKFEKLQRRSPEVWVREPIERRTMDPIAALGAETPRLDSGMNPYSRASDGQFVMQYSMSGPAVMPGPSNSFIPSSDTHRKKQQYAGDSQMIPGQAPAAQTPDLGAAIAAALQDLMPSLVQSVQQKMSGDAADAIDPADADAPRGIEPEPAASPAQAPAPAPADDDPQKKFGGNCAAAYAAGMAATKYSRTEFDGLTKVVAKQTAELKQVRDTMAKERRDVMRYSRLTELSREFAFDVKDELDVVQDLTDAQFETHCTKTVAKYQKRDDIVGLELYEGPGDPERYSKSNGPTPAQVEKYSRDAASMAANNNAKPGAPHMSFETAFETICKQHGVAV